METCPVTHCPRKGFSDPHKARRADPRFGRITAANLVQIISVFPSTSPPPASAPLPSLGWTFQLVVSFSNLKIKDFTSALTSLQNTISQNSRGLTLSFTLSGTRLSVPAGARLQVRGPGHPGSRASAGHRWSRGIQGRCGRQPDQCDVERRVTGVLADRRFALGARFGHPGPNPLPSRPRAQTTSSRTGF